MSTAELEALRARVALLETERDAVTAERDVATAERDVVAAERDVATAERERYRQLYLEMLELARKLELGLHGQKSERSEGDAQLTLQILGQLLAGEAQPVPRPPRPKADDGGKPKGKPGRRPLPEQLPRVDIEVLPEEVQREGLDAFERIGEEVSETLERRPASLVVVRVTRPKFVRRDRDRNAETKVLIAPSSERSIPGGIAGPNLLAETVVRRWEDHLPANRMQKIYKREGLDLARSTICRWHMHLASQLVQPLVAAMWMDAMAKAPYLCMDATGVLVQAEHKCERGHFWVVVAPPLHVLFAFSNKHDGAAVDELIVKYGYKGPLVVDAHTVYDHLYREHEITEVACWSHARRYFVKALSSEPERAQEALAMIRELFMLERIWANAPPKKRKAGRQAKSKPIVDAFFKWREQQASYALDDSPLDKALTYVFNQREALERFLDDGRLPLHNNGSELELRRQAVGRKNWLFIASEAGALANTTFVSLLASCQMHGIEPQAYLRDLFCLLPDWPISRVLELAPAYWKETREQQDTKRRLAACLFRQVALGEHQAQA